MKKLTLRHQQFAEAFVANGGHAGKAYRAIRPGQEMSDVYARMRGNELVQYPLVAEYIDRLREDAVKRNQVTVDRLIQELAAIALSDIRNIIDYDGERLSLKAFDAMPEEASRTISEIADTKDGAPKVKMWSKLEAMNQLTRLLGLVPAEKREITGKDGKDLFPQEQMSDLDFARLLAYHLHKGERHAGDLKAIESDEESP